MTKREKKKQDFNANIWMLHDQKSIKTLNKIYAATCINIACVVHFKFNDDISKFVKYYINVKRHMALAARRRLTKEQAARFASVRKQYNSFFGRIYGTNNSLNAKILKFNK